MTHETLSFLDLEGVLAPEMWPHLANRFGVEAWRATTRDQSNYRVLMQHRVAAMTERQISIESMCSAIGELKPLDGAVAFVAALRRSGRVVIVTDSFWPLNKPLLDHFTVDWLFCNRLQGDRASDVSGLDYWSGAGGKERCFERFHDHTARTVAVGDAFNDLSMIRKADVGFLFRPSDVTRTAAPDIATVTTYDEVLAALSEPRAGLVPIAERTA